MVDRRTRLLGCIFSVISSAFLLGLAAAPAAADQPSTVEEHIVRPPEVVGECAGHPITAEFDVLRRVTTFYVDDTPVRRVVHARVSGTIRDTVTGASLPAFGVRVITFDPVTGQLLSSTGSNVHVVAPGFGTVQLAAGHFGVNAQGDFYAHGRLDEPVTARLCEALAAQ